MSPPQRITITAVVIVLRPAISFTVPTLHLSLPRRVFGGLYEMLLPVISTAEPVLGSLPLVPNLLTVHLYSYIITDINSIVTMITKKVTIDVTTHSLTQALNVIVGSNHTATSLVACNRL
jgi:hypothetical protein